MPYFNSNNLIGKTIEESEKLLVGTGYKLSVVKLGYGVTGWCDRGDLATIHVSVQNGIIEKILRNPL